MCISVFLEPELPIAVLDDLKSMIPEVYHQHLPEATLHRPMEV
jgi:hypothetical protein